mmetsp:Transcript_10567/g.41075  ORF Transcript_10567/g.41075 Transcript_10567/m.41075 type:complete len:275 (+) Transcript_10567:59-883(+)
MGMDSLPGRVHKAVQLPRSCLAGQWCASVLGGDTRFRDQALALPVSLPASVKHPACLKSCRNEGRKINDISAGVGQGLHGVNDLVTQAVVGQAGLLTAAPAVTCSDPLRRRVECARWYHWCSTIRVRSEPHGRVAPPACRSRTVVGELASHGSARRASAAAGCSRRPAPARLRLSVVRLRLALLGATGVAHGLSWKKARLARAGALRVAAGGKGSHARGHRHRLPLPRNESAMERNLLLRVGPWLPHGLGGAQLRVLVRNICVRGWLGSAQGRL